MRYGFFTIPVDDSVPAQDEMDAFLTSHRILSVEKVFVADGRNSLWCLRVVLVPTLQRGNAGRSLRGPGC